MNARGAKAQRKKLVPKVGDHVLVGHPGITMPHEWFIAAVAWTDGADMLTRHPMSNGEICNQVLPVEEVLAIGSFADLTDFKLGCAKQVRSLQRRVSACEQALARARARVWEHLDEIAAGWRPPS